MLMKKLDNIVTSYSDFENKHDWIDLELIGKKCKGKSFVELTDKAHIAGGWDKLTADGYPYVDDVIFADIDGKKVGFAMVAQQHAMYEDVEVRKDTLNLLNIMVLPEYVGKGVGDKLLEAVFDYGKQMGYTSVELIVKVDINKFNVNKNTYLDNGLQNIKTYENVNSPKNEKNIYFRADVDASVRNFSKAVYESFKTFVKRDLTALDEQVLAKEISKKYIDIVKSKKKLTKEEIDTIKKDPIFNDLSIGLKDVIKNKDYPEPTVITRSQLTMCKVLKTISSVFKPSSNMCGDLSRIQHTDKVQRILCGVGDQILNEQNQKRIKNNDAFGSLNRI